MSIAEQAREIVIEAWLDVGMSPELYADAFAAVKAGNADNTTAVRIAINALSRKR